MSYPLPLSPLPSLRGCPRPNLESPDLHGFVDDEVVSRMVADQPPIVRLEPVRTPVLREDLVLSSSDHDDYAGWHGGISPRLTARPAFEIPMSAVKRPRRGGLEFASRRAAPPVGDEPGLEPSYQSGHRWWLAATAGALCAVLAATVLLSLAWRSPLPGSDATLDLAPPTPAPVRIEPQFAAPPSTPREITSHSLVP